MAEKAPSTGSGDPSQPIDFAGLNRPLSFVLDVKERLEDGEKQRYDKFLAAFARFQESTASPAPVLVEQTNVETLRAEVRELLAGHGDLLAEFEYLSSK